MTKKVSTLVLIMLVFSACASTEPTRFYLLSSAANPSQVGAAVEQTPLHILVGSIRLPEYLNRSQIVTRFSENELELGWLDRWGEPLEDNFSHVLMQNIEQLLHCRCTSALAAKPPMGVTHRVEVEVVRMDGILGEKASLDAWWSVYTPEKKMLLTRRSSFTRPVKGKGYEAFVRAQSEILFDFSREIAIAIADLQKRQMTGDGR